MHRGGNQLDANKCSKVAQIDTDRTSEEEPFLQMRCVYVVALSKHINYLIKQAEKTCPDGKSMLVLSLIKTYTFSSVKSFPIHFPLLTALLRPNELLLSLRKLTVLMSL